MPLTKRVLIVEDNPHVVEMFSYALKKMALADPQKQVSMDILVAGNGHEAWQKLQTESVDLVLADVYMPVMDGIALLGKIRASDNPRLREQPVVIFSGGEDTKFRAMDAGADVFLKKPIRFQEIAETVKRLWNW